MDEHPFPPFALVGAGLLILTTVIGVGSIQLHKHFSTAAPAAEIAGATVQQARLLRFVDQGDGAAVYGGHVRVFDVHTGAELPPLRERDGFVRAILNSLAYERTKRSISPAPIYKLTKWSNGSLTMSDPVTGARINLGSFGIGNKNVFYRFFEPAEAKSSSVRESESAL